MGAVKCIGLVIGSLKKVGNKKIKFYYKQTCKIYIFVIFRKIMDTHLKNEKVITANYLA